MALESVREGAGNPVMPLIGEADLSLKLIVALFVGLMIISLIRPASENAAQYVAGIVGNVVGVDPVSGESSGPLGGAFD